MSNTPSLNSLSSQIHHRPPSPTSTASFAFSLPSPSLSRPERLFHSTQQKLSEVEAAVAPSSGSHPSLHPGAYVFGPAHAEALEELRSAQIHLAQAWMRVEDNGEQEEIDREHEEVESDGGGAGKGKGKGKGGEGDNWEGGVDLRLAKMRREANERQFRKVRELVMDVGGRLDGVADKMRRVESESRGVWEEHGNGEEEEEDDHEAIRSRKGSLES